MPATPASTASSSSASPPQGSIAGRSAPRGFLPTAGASSTPRRPPSEPGSVPAFAAAGAGAGPASSTPCRVWPAGGVPDRRWRAQWPGRGGVRGSSASASGICARAASGSSACRRCELAQTHRLLLAKRLLADTVAPGDPHRVCQRVPEPAPVQLGLPRAVPAEPARAPAQSAARQPPASLVRITLAYRPPFAWNALLALAGPGRDSGSRAREERRYARTVRVEGRTGVVFAEDRSHAEDHLRSISRPRSCRRSCRSSRASATCSTSTQSPLWSTRSSSAAASARCRPAARASHSRRSRRLRGRMSRAARPPARGGR